MIRVVWTILLIKLNSGQSLPNCPKSNIKFEKIIGVPPIQVNQQPVLFKLAHNEPIRPITFDCLERCEANEACHGFILFYNKFECYLHDKDVTIRYQWTDNNYASDNNVAVFNKVCSETGTNCTKAWIFERVRGATLVTNNAKLVATNITSAECEMACRKETDFICRSANLKIDLGNDLKNKEVTGQCFLQGTDRHLMPTGYRVSTYDDYYLEDQCVEDNDDAEYCTYEEYENVTFTHEDYMFENVTKEECQDKCDSFPSFNCRGYSFARYPQPLCLLHSEDTKLRGPRSLQEDHQSTYYEKARCLNITVSCTETSMIVHYQPEINFRGKLYMQGYSEDQKCYVIGGGNATVSLKLPLMDGECGILQAGSEQNRTLLSGTLIIQYNALIQTQSDRLLKVGCIFGSDNKIVLGTGITVAPKPNTGNTIINSSSNQTVSINMRIVDLKTQKETADTQIGQELQLIIEAEDPSNTSDFWVNHLVAMSEKGDESIFLLDDRGCPTNADIFPMMTKEVSNNKRRLIATFQAFKFASSPILRFSVNVQFCQKECLPIACKSSRTTREITTNYIKTINGTVKAPFPSKWDNKTDVISSVVKVMPLEYVMVVRDSSSPPDRLILGSKDGTILVAGYNYATNEVCMDFSLVIGLIITWIIVQIIFITVCIFLVQRYKKYYEEEYARASLEHLNKNFGLGFSNLENRRVRWADNDDMM